jgi:ClpP class serine protease
MHLSDFFTPGAWAILPHALEAFFQSLLGGITPGSEHGPVPQAASSASGDGPPSGYLYAQVEGIAFINVRGVIARRGGSVSFFGMTFSWEGQDTIRAAIAMAMQDPGVKAVLLSFDSPGGTAAG